MDLSSSISSTSSSSSSLSVKSNTMPQSSLTTSYVTIPYQKFLDILVPEFDAESFSVNVAGRNHSITDSIAQCSDLESQFMSLLRIFTQDPSITFNCDLGHNGINIVSNWEEPLRLFLKVEDTDFDSDSDDGLEYLYNGFSKRRQLMCDKSVSDAMSTGIPRRHVFGVFVGKDDAYLLYYDHSTAIVSEPINWVNNSETFWGAIHTMSHLDPDRFGCETGILRLSDYVLNLDGLELLLLGVIRTSESVFGQGTSMVRARVISGGPYKDQIVAVRFSYVPKDKGWGREADMLRAIRQKAGASEGSRKYLDGFPELIASKVVPPSAMEERIRMMLGDIYDLRELRVYVFAEELYPVTSLTSDVELLKVFRDILDCHHWLYTDMQLLHRALSADNIMFRRVGNTIHGVLNDFDLAVHLDDINSPPSPLTCSEIRPFAPPDIFNKPLDPHLYRFELAALFYVIYFIIANYENGKRIPQLQDPFDGWFSSDTRGTIVPGSKAILIFDNRNIKLTSNR
ncbi:hypothetical protein BDQ17DRAFT_1430042 [Cyathus striatus]|nr:hypothetical protein BDQ17DRAFT_1430042 [Cyathus striatus]